MALRQQRDGVLEPALRCGVVGELAESHPLDVRVARLTCLTELALSDFSGAFDVAALVVRPSKRSSRPLRVVLIADLAGSLVGSVGNRWATQPAETGRDRAPVRWASSRFASRPVSAGRSAAAFSQSQGRRFDPYTAHPRKARGRAVFSQSTVLASRLHRQCGQQCRRGARFRGLVQERSSDSCSGRRRVQGGVDGLILRERRPPTHRTPGRRDDLMDEVANLVGARSSESAALSGSRCQRRPGFRP